MASVVAVAGEVTGRTVGGAMSEIGMRVLARGDDADDELNYVTRTGTGRTLKSSTMVLRDSMRHGVRGPLCQRGRHRGRPRAEPPRRARRGRMVPPRTHP